MIRRLFSLLSPQSASGAKMERRARPSLETLEDRTTPTVTIANVGGVLTIRGDVNPLSPPLPNLPIATTDTVTITQTATAGSFTVAATTSAGVVVGAGVYTGITSIDIDLGTTAAANAVQTVNFFSDGSAVVAAFAGAVAVKNTNSQGGLTVNIGNAGNATDNVTFTGPMNIDSSSAAFNFTVNIGNVGGSRTTLGNVTTTSGPVFAAVNLVGVLDTTMGFLSVNNSTGNANKLTMFGGNILSGFLSFTGGIGGDTVTVDQTTVGGNLGVSLGGGAGVNTLNLQSTLAGANNVVGNVFYSGSSTFGGSGDNLNIANVAGAVSTVNGYVSYNAAGSNGSTVQIANVGGGSVATIGTFLSIVHDAAGLGSFTKIGGASSATAIGQNFAVVGGTGIDTVTLNKLTVGGTTSISTDAGADAVTLTGADASTYNGALTVNAGGATDVSADVINISAGGNFATFRSTSTFSAGGGIDTLAKLGKGIFTGGAPIINADIEIVTV